MKPSDSIQARTAKIREAEFERFNDFGSVIQSVSFYAH